MNRELVEKIGSWEISLTRNVHMYTHALSVKKGEYRVSIPCEDLPTNVKTIGMWLYNLELSNKYIEELKSVLLELATKQNVLCKVYVSPEEYFSNE